MLILLALLLLGQVPNPFDAEAKKAELKLAEKPEDPAANLAVGKRLLYAGDGEKAVPFLLKGSDPTLKAAAKAETELDPSNLLFLLEAGDLWAQAMSANRPLRQACLDRASSWYAKAWPGLDELRKMKLRERLAKLYAPAIPGKAVGFPKGWGGPLGGKWKVEVQAARVHAGGTALLIQPQAENGLSEVFRANPMAVSGGQKLEISAWVLSDGTNYLSDGFVAHVLGSDGAAAASLTFPIRADFPIWTKVSKEISTPKGSEKLTLSFVIGSGKGLIFVSDLSVKLDGKELLPPEGF